MERLTIRDDDGTIRIKREINGNVCFSNYMRSFDIEAVCRLGAYEDTGLTPGEVRSLWGEWNAMLSVLNSIGSYDRLRELAKADKDGRLLVLPCKENTLVWKISHRINGKHEIEQKYFNLTYSRVEDFGKTLFLTREEAEAALKEMKKDG